jgi:hypothetical protein
VTSFIDGVAEVGAEGELTVRTCGHEVVAAAFAEGDRTMEAFGVVFDALCGSTPLVTSYVSITNLPGV